LHFERTPASSNSTSDWQINAKASRNRADAAAARGVAAARLFGFSRQNATRRSALFQNSHRLPDHRDFDGLHMAIAGDHSAIGAHAHANLLGWVTMAIFGGYHALNPAKAERRLAMI
jgi:hypothetical protein